MGERDSSPDVGHWSTVAVPASASCEAETHQNTTIGLAQAWQYTSVSRCDSIKVQHHRKYLASSSHVPFHVRFRKRSFDALAVAAWNHLRGNNRSTTSLDRVRPQSFARPLLWVAAPPRACPHSCHGSSESSMAARALQAHLHSSSKPPCRSRLSQSP